MASGSPSDSCKWLLVEWKSGGRDVVFIKAVVSPSEEELKIDDMIMVNRRGEPEEAKLVARARVRVRLDAMINQSLRRASPIAGPSTKRDEEPEEFCESASSWVPSDEESTESADSDEVPRKKNKIERCQRKKMITPPHRATQIIPKSMQQTNVSTIVKFKKPNNDSLNLSMKKSLPKSQARKSALQNGKDNETLTLDRRGYLQIEKSFKFLFKLLTNMKKTVTANTNQSSEEQEQNPTNNPPVTVDMDQSENQPKKSPVAMADYETIKVLNQTEPSSYEKTVEDINDGEEIESDHAEFNRSDDNVTFTNKFNNTAVKTVQNKVPENQEWIPIGSGTTLIHKDKFKTVNWKSYTIATRTLLLAAFPRRVLATHSLTGKKSPAFRNKPAKMCLDPKITMDVIYEIMDRFHVRENLVRSIITTKCADECKMMKTRNKKIGKTNEIMPPPPPPPSPAVQNNSEEPNVA